MGSSDTPPPHVPPSYMLITNTLLQIGGLLWTACYILSTRVSFKTKTYGMPIFALAFNFGWELIYLMVAPSFLEKAVFTLWCVLDVFLFIGVFKYGEREWKHSPFVGRNLGKIVLVMTIWCCGFHYVSSRFWIENLIGRKEGKGDGADMTELAFWSAAVAQAYGSMACLAQLVVRQHTGGGHENIGFFHCV
ncbi:hypothetical protein GLAREA_08299 [Glarea lozoyensis ATCC 20868]|uniref:Integral membrane protein n=1 Tax=Glarea lozoyensis (strain ATCC 20868 / MF5171) TaxID=1116229 RepID=S3CD30_GLAL2|nr:uncharacterized protein GLAREA_08299 [Glarea lozoyensis ATCC 20868]EPE24447.1 hypothetical protein GLAREA_08299 [Glarea lozoyensis ATCC 20868]